MINFLNTGKNNKLKIFIYLFLAFIFLHLQIGCYYKNFYQVRKHDSESEEFSKMKMDLSQKEKKYIIIHVAGEKYHLYNIVLDQDNMMLKANYDIASAKHQLYIPDSNQSKRYKEKEGQDVILNEVHIIGRNFSLSPDKTIAIPLENIERIDIIEKDKGKSTASYVFSTISIAYGVVVMIAIIIFLTKSSCPFIYVEDGNDYVFKGEIYGGAIFKPLERDDFMYLKSIKGNDSIVKIKITNELKERQYTDIAELIVVEHEPDEKVFIDSKGVIHSVTNIQPPVEASLNENHNYLHEVSYLDSAFCIFNSSALENNVNELTLKFPRPVNNNNAKLILNAKNSLWLDFAFGEMTKLFGGSYDKWIEQNRTGNAEKMKKWTTEQYLPLSVYMKESNNWVLVERIPTIGPLATRDFCIPIDLSGIGNDTVEIKLTCGFMFWELNYAGLGFGDDTNLKTEIISAFNAYDQDNVSITKEILTVDKDYLFQPEPGYEATIIYKIPPKNSVNHQSVFIYTRGYYEHVRDYKGLPDIVKLNSLKKEGAFVNFSKELFDRVSKQLGYENVSVQ